MQTKRRKSEREPKPAGRLVSQSTAAKLLRVSRGTVVARVASGDLEAEMVDNTPVIVRSSIDAYLRRRDAA